MSTDDFQDRATSRRWQRGVADDLIAGHGRIAVEFFDVGCSRRPSWRGRPQAAALLAAIADPDRGFDAIVVGEYERAFAGRQLLDLLPLLEQHGVQLWLPETHGPVDRHNSAHEALIMPYETLTRRFNNYRSIADEQSAKMPQGVCCIATQRPRQADQWHDAPP